MTRQPLEGVRVLEFGNLIAGPYCGMLLGDMGADVIKVEFTSGDMMRAAAPNMDGESPVFMSLNRNKRSVVVDLKSQSGTDLVYRLVRGADVVLENFRPGVMDGLRLGASKLRSIRPELVYVSVSGFGQTGSLRHRAAVNLVIEAFSGTLSITGEPGQMPTRPGIQTGDIIGAMFATYAVLSGLVGRFKAGDGRTADVALVEASLAVAVFETAAYLETGEIPQPLGARHRLTAPYQLFEAKEGRYIAIGCPNDAMFEKVVTVLGRRELITDPRFSNYNLRKVNEESLIHTISELVKSWDANELENALVSAGVPCSKVNNYGEVLNNAHLISRNILQEVEHPKAGKVKVVRNPVLFDKGGPAVNHPAPMLGQHSFEVLEGLGYTKGEIRDLVKQGVVRGNGAVR